MSPRCDPLTLVPLCDHVPDWQPRILLGMVEARSVNVKNTTTTTTCIELGLRRGGGVGSSEDCFVSDLPCLLKDCKYCNAVYRSMFFFLLWLSPTFASSSFLGIMRTLSYDILVRFEMPAFHDISSKKDKEGPSLGSLIIEFLTVIL